jgi:hypothetical protein
MTARRKWIVAWPTGAAIGVANGVVRQAIYAKRLGERPAHQVSTATALAAFAAYFAWLERRSPIRDRTEALQIGGAWLGLTVAFEFGFGRRVAKLSWQELLADYNLAAGRTWPLVLAWLALGPEVVRSLRAEMVPD